MLLTREGKFFFYGCIFFVYIFSWLIQEKLCLNWDISQLIRATKLMLAGGTYSNDFFIPNPPMILLLYTPPVIISKWLGIKVMLPFRIYIYLLTTISFLMCVSLAKRIFSKEDNFLASAFLITMLITFLMMPFYQLGQRDCLLLILIMPYLLLISLRLEEKPVNSFDAISVGLLAGLGLAIKPQFLILPFIIELYYLLHKRKWLAWIRPEVIIIICLYAFYLVVILLFFPDFIFDVMPYVMHMYYESISVSWSQLIWNPLAIFSIIPLVFYLIQLKSNRYPILSRVLILALLGFTVSYFAQRTLFLYHLLPILFLSVLLLVLFFGMLITRRSYNRYDYIAMGTVIWVASIYLYFFKPSIWTIFGFYPVVFFSFFACLFAVLLYVSQTQKNLLFVGLKLALIIAFGIWVYYVGIRISWYAWSPLITISMLILIFLALVSKQKKTMGVQLTSVVLGMMIFSFPVQTALDLYAIGTSYNEKVLGNLKDFIKKQPPHQTMYVFSTMTNYNAPLMDYTDAESVERFECLWMVGSLARQLSEDEQALRQYIRNNKEKRFFINMIAEDIVKYKPDLIFVDMRKNNSLMNQDVKYFNFVSYFLENSLIAKEWKHYRYLTTLKGGDFFAYPYELAIYRREKGNFL